jgi:hypothetical protein
VYYKLGKYDDAETAYKTLIERATSPKPESDSPKGGHGQGHHSTAAAKIAADDLLVLKAMSNLSMLLKKMKRMEEAEVQAVYCYFSCSDFSVSVLYSHRYFVS